MAQLYVLSGPDIGRSFGVQHGDTLGRSTECVITLKHASLSRKHAHLECVEGRWFVVDDNSRNGVLVNKQRTPRAELADMSEFQLGELHLRFRTSAPAEAAPPSRPASAARPASAPPAPAIAPSSGPPAEPEELALEGETDAGVGAEGGGPVFTSGGGAHAPVIRPSGPSPYQAAGPFALPKDESAAAARRPGPPVPAPRKLDDAGGDQPLLARREGSSAPPPPGAASKLEHSMLDTGFGRGQAAAGATISRSTYKPGERILQYSKVEGGPVELAQLSAPARWALYALGAALMAAIAWFVFRGTAALKSRALEGSGAAEQLEPLVDEPVSEPTRR